MKHFTCVPSSVLTTALWLLSLLSSCENWDLAREIDFPKVMANQWEAEVEVRPGLSDSRACNYL